MGRPSQLPHTFPTYIGSVLESLGDLPALFETKLYGQKVNLAKLDCYTCGFTSFGRTMGNASLDERGALYRRCAIPDTYKDAMEGKVAIDGRRITSTRQTS